MITPEYKRPSFSSLLIQEVKPSTDKEKPKEPDTMATAEAINKALQGLPGMVTALQTKDYTSALKSKLNLTMVLQCSCFQSLHPYRLSTPSVYPY